jgi:uncharacterized protein DUF7033
MLSRMTLLVQAPQGYEPERRYIADVVFAEWLGLDCRVALEERRDVRITLAGDPDGRSVTMPDGLFATPSEAWLTPASLPRSPLSWRRVDDSTPAEQRLPVLYGATGPVAPLGRAEADAVIVDVDVLGSCFYALSRYEEYVVPTRDAYGRFPAAASLGQREGFLGIPVADAYVELLWSALQRMWPRLQRRAQRYAVALTHDVDDPLASLGRSRAQLVRQLGADALLRRDPGLMARRARSWLGLARGDYRHDPYNTFGLLMDVSERCGLTSAFYFLATDTTAAPEDPPYTLENPWIGSLMARIDARGHEIGFHAGFHTYRDEERTREEFQRLRRAAERTGVQQSLWGGRQHYLRWENPSTWSNWELAGLDYDTTLAFADDIGFRTGTCREFPAFHLLERRQLRLRERPFQIMDRTLFEYLRLSEDAAFDAVVAVASECRRYGGTLGILWHNSQLLTARHKRFYERIVGRVADLA